MYRRDDRHVILERLLKSAVQHRGLHPVKRPDVPAAGRLFRRRLIAAQPEQPARRLHPRHRAQVLPRAIPAQQRAAEPYVAGSDAIGMTMGYYDTSSLPIYQYLHSPAHPHYAIADDFFQGAFGGSFLNHQWLIAAATPTYPNASS